MADSNIGTRSVSDPLALRALAHPLRIRLLRLVGREGTLTAADAARQLGVSHALASHHLRQLAKYGYVEQADAPDGRARPWRVTTTSFELDPAEESGWDAADALQRLAVDQAGRDVEEWQRRRPEEDPRWQALAGVRSGLVYLTADQLEEALAAWAAILQPLVDQAPIGHHDARHPASRPVSYALVTVPIDPTARGG
ncbi:helix-turn-helix domain-containing protein [Amnibacterium sp. CER49]|uniref:ArsR/SmtB family transcription factor n=1 Tax=Amnibacterium sp. CER49 TaxID=3039161 RepID=UPI00244B9072|nr:helix-turn-helix domain-containing protein [Amnibacterium sp. CER49]MDH2445415.1 helix-turn-helix domain-containing protein [Amnibacterium sp. CER49]